MAATSGSGYIIGNVIFRPTFHELTSVSQGWLNRLGQSWARLKAETWPQIKCKWIMAAISGSGDITGNVIFRPTLHELTSVSRGWLNRLGQSWVRLKAIMWPQIKCKWIMVVTSGSGDITGNRIFRSTSIKLTSFSRRWLNRFGQTWARLKAIIWPRIK